MAGTERMVSTAAVATAPPGRGGLAAIVELLKPITWFAPMWAFGCGVVSSGVPLHGHVLLIIAGIALAGPLVCGTSQAANDWYDRDVDAINEPNRPIPSGRVPGRRGLHVALVWTALSGIVAALLGVWTLGAALVGLLLAWIYSAPPVRLKQNGWWSCLACAACYEGLPWFTGAAIMAGTRPDWRIIGIAALYSLGAHGIMTLNDFKSVDGDRATGIGSLPVRLGVERAAQLACFVMAAPQVVVVALLILWGLPIHAGAVAAVLIAQLALMVKLLGNPRERAPWYNATGTSLYVIGMLVTAFAIRPVFPT
jgi:chlorophyll synthase